MEQKTIVKNTEKCIYLIKEGTVEFYLVIPNSRRLAILLNLQTNIDDYSIQNIFISADKTVVVPKFSSQVSLNIASNNSAVFNNVDNILSQLINFSHKMLTYNKVEVVEEIFITSDTTYQLFTRWFVQKYNGRVKLFTNNVNVIPNNNPPSAMNDNMSMPSNNIQTTNPVSTASDVPINTQVASEVSITPESNVSKQSAPEIESKNEQGGEINNNKELGFVSYVLLGVLAAVVSLVFLYLII